MKHTQDLFFVDTPVVTSESLLKEKIQSVSKPHFCVHWLAIEGQQLYERDKTTERKEKRNSKNVAVEVRQIVQHK